MINKKQVLIIGAGAIGIGLAVAMDKSKHSIYLKSKDAFITEEIFLSVNDTLLAQKINPPSIGKKMDIVIITVKDYDIISVLEKYNSFFRVNTDILIIQNGISIFDRDYLFTKKRFKSYNIIRVITKVCAIKKDIYKSKWIDNLIFTYNIKDREFFKSNSLFNKNIIHIKQSLNFKIDFFTKLLINSSINTVGALYNKNCKEILSDTSMLKEVLTIAEEIHLLANKLGIPLCNSDEIICNSLEKMGTFPTSMVQDISQNKQIEIDAIVNRPLFLAQKHNLTLKSLTNIRDKLSKKYS